MLMVTSLIMLMIMSLGMLMIASLDIMITSLGMLMITSLSMLVIAYLDMLMIMFLKMLTITSPQPYSVLSHNTSSLPQKGLPKSVSLCVDRRHRLPPSYLNLKPLSFDVSTVMVLLDMTSSNWKENRPADLRRQHHQAIMLHMSSLDFVGNFLETQQRSGLW